jgi:hypothetical protein
MEIINLKVNEIKRYEKNARTHSKDQVEQIKMSIIRFGFNNPILVDENYELIAGHGRLMAAEEMKRKDVPAIVLKHLTPEQKKAYVIADNKIAMNSGWDFDLLKAELLELGEFDSLEDDNILESLGFANFELDSLLGFREDGASPDKVEKGNIDGNYAEGEWNEMPEFKQGDKESFRHVIVHFKTQEDAAEFFELIKHPHTDKTKSIWHPRQVNMDTESKRY